MEYQYHKQHKNLTIVKREKKDFVEMESYSNGRMVVELEDQKQKNERLARRRAVDRVKKLANDKKMCSMGLKWGS